MVKLFNVVVVGAAAQTTTDAPTTPAATTTTEGPFNCYINNGGCSHTCNSASAACECPTCWELADDGLKCIPAAGEVTTTCGANTMTMTINKCVLEGSHDYSGAYVGDDQDESACKPVVSEDGLSYTLTHGLDECGMALEFDADNEVLKYSNQMTIPPVMKDIIYVDQRLQWAFTCSYSTSYDVSEDMTVNAASLTDDFESTGSFDVSLSFYQTDAFENEQEESSYQVGKPINFGITFNGGQPLNDLVFVPGKCEVMNKANEDEVWKVWDSGFEGDVAGMCDGTPNPVNFQILQSPSADSAFYGMTYQGFAFGSVTGSSGDQQLKCNVNVCHVDVCNSACKKGCFDDESCEETTTEEPATTDSGVSTAAPTTAPLSTVP